MSEHHPGAPFGDNQQPFIGIPSFMRQPVTRDLTGADVAVLGIPYDSGTSYRSGARFGPKAIREASLMLWGYNPVLRTRPLDHLHLVDYGDVETVPVDIRINNARIETAAGAILDAGAALIALGGDHSITLPLLRAHAARSGPLAVVHFDSHPDTWDQEYGPGIPFSHGTPFRRALEEGLIDHTAYIQVGIRGSLSGPEDYEDALALGAEMITIGEAFDLGIPQVIERIHDKVAGKRVYVSLDIDAADPAYAPGTGTPEVGGFTSYQLLQLLRGLKGLDLAGFDLVEVNPLFDPGGITGLLAANLVFEYLSLFAQRQT